MFGYIMIGVSDMVCVEEFYNGLLVEVGVKQFFGMDRIKFYGMGLDVVMFVICILYDEKEQYKGNGWMIVILGGFKEGVDKFYVKVLEFGVIDEGVFGDWVLDVFYGVYVCDLDGNKICFMDMKMGQVVLFFWCWVFKCLIFVLYLLKCCWGCGR